MSIQISLAAIDQADSIAEVLHRAFLEYEPLYTPEGFAATTPSAEKIQARWSEGPVWVAMQEGVIVGTVAAVSKGDSLYIRSMAIVPSVRGLGTGRLMLEHVEAYARKNNFRRMFLSTTPFLERAIKLYERFGFKRIDQGPHELFGTPLFTMEMTL